MKWWKLLAEAFETKKSGAQGSLDLVEHGPDLLEVLEVGADREARGVKPLDLGDSLGRGRSPLTPCS